MRSWRRALRGVWLAAGLFSLLVVGTAVWLLGEIARSAERGAAGRVEALARDAETTLNRNLVQLDLLLAGLEDLPGLHDPAAPDAAALSTMLRRFVEQRLLLRDLALVDARGSVLAAAHAAPRPGAAAGAPGRRARAAGPGLDDGGTRHPPGHRRARDPPRARDRPARARAAGCRRDPAGVGAGHAAVPRAAGRRLVDRGRDPRRAAAGQRAA
jgi:hypothetical protein